MASACANSSEAWGSTGGVPRQSGENNGLVNALALCLLDHSDDWVLMGLFRTHPRVHPPRPTLYRLWVAPRSHGQSPQSATADGRLKALDEKGIAMKGMRDSV